MTFRHSGLVILVTLVILFLNITKAEALLAMSIPKLVPLTSGDFALVDDDDFERVMMHTWGLMLGYARASIGGKHTTLHRFIVDAPEGEHVDHINHNGLDNRKSNLRLCSPSQNMAWARRVKVKSGEVFEGRQVRATSSKYHGVSFRTDRKRWTAYIGTKKDRKMLGCYATEDEAAVAYNDAALKKYGEFAQLNVITP